MALSLVEGRQAKWTAAAIFEVKNGKVHSFTKEWDKLRMWKQLGWLCGIVPLFQLQDIFREQNALNAQICLIAWGSALKFCLEVRALTRRFYRRREMIIRKG